MSQAEFETRFTVGRRVPILSLTSTTYMDRVARDFAAGNATAFRADQTVSVVVRYDARDARDLRPAAYHDDSEGEFVLLPGAEFVVKSVELDAIRSSGRTMHVVTLKQVKRAT